MNIKKQYRGETLELHLPGDLDAAAVVELRGEFEAVVGESLKRVIVDLSATQFIDSSGIGALVFLFKRLRAVGKQMLLVGVAGQPHRLLDSLRIFEHIPHVTRPGARPGSLVEASA